MKIFGNKIKLSSRSDIYIQESFSRFVFEGYEKWDEMYKKEA
jgi:hypothetical protein